MLVISNCNGASFVEVGAGTYLIIASKIGCIVPSRAAGSDPAKPNLPEPYNTGNSN